MKEPNFKSQNVSRESKMTWLRRFITSKTSDSVVLRSYLILETKDRRRLKYVVVLQILMGLLDLLGVALFGVLGSIAINGVSSKSPGNRVTAVLEFLNLGGQTLQMQAFAVGSLAVFVLITRTLISVFFIRRTLIFLSRRAANLTRQLTDQLLAQDLLFVQRRTSQETIYALTAGAGTIVLGVLGTAVSIISDIALLIILSFGLFIVDPIIAMSSYLIFGLVAIILYQLMHQRARKLGEKSTQLSIKSAELITEVLLTYRESTVRNCREFYRDRISRTRFEAADTIAEVQFQPSISKYVLESTVVLGTLILAGVQFSLQDSTRAVGTLAVFMAAATRIAPAVLRLQQGALQMKGNLGSAEQTFDLIYDLTGLKGLGSTQSEINFVHSNFEPNVSLRKVYFSYPDSSKFQLRDIDFHANPGEVVAVVGKSGSGKTTMIDILLGVLRPEMGEIKVSGLTPMQAISKWPGAIGYVPQNVAIINGTIRRNIVLGFPESPGYDFDIWEVLRTAQLEDFVKNLPLGLDTQVGEFGTRLSGGQRQRLGIARALFTKPKLLILDEATSALDGMTESELSREISSLKGEITIIIIAHRISTIKEADRIYHVENGQVAQVGNFETLAANIESFRDFLSGRDT
jgi:ABC-type multidrug transport system fused ATPase/permease subunit